MSQTESETHPLTPFIEAAKSKGASDEALARLLEERGWSARRIYPALASYYEGLTGVAIPAAPRTAAESARDAFLYLLTFTTLGVWTIGLGAVFFTLLEYWLPDRAGHPYYHNLITVLSGNVAAVLVAFPAYLLTARLIGRGLEAQPERYESGVRTWLTYIALFLAAGVVIGDLTTFLAFFLRGELTARFAMKVAVVLALSGGVFWHYLATLKPGADHRRSRMFALAAAALVALGLVPGFWALGTPAGQRNVATDERRLEDLAEVARNVDRYWYRESKLPAALRATVPANTRLPERFLDPETGRLYEYRPGAGSKYELCAVFTTDTRSDEKRKPNQAHHPAGPYCFALDAAQPATDPLRR